MQIITGYTGESHVTSADDASLYRGIFGAGDYVLDIGNKFAATIIDNNTIRIADGDLIIQGHQGRIRTNDYEEVTIDNGTPGEKRNDFIVARYQKNTTTGIESITLEVVKGTPGETAVDPDVVQEDLSTGGTQRDFALYRVSLNGLVLESVTSLFTVLPNLEVFKTHQAESAQKHITESGENANGRYVRFDDGTQICWRSVSIPGSGWTQSAYAPFYYKNITVSLPVSFVGTAYPIYSNQESSIARRGSWVTNCVMSGSNAVGIWLAALATYDTDTMGNLLVIGRWK